jgi:hypothetical protein
MAVPIRQEVARRQGNDLALVLDGVSTPIAPGEGSR